jgi:diguanylate cyclase (GGDEF)-like protein/PAS domain S-box-containing protein
MSSKSGPGLDQLKRDNGLVALGLRQNLVRVLFVHRFPADVERCVHELMSARFTVISDVVGTPGEFTERLSLEPFDIVVAEFPNPRWQETQIFDLLRLSKKAAPLIFLVRTARRETVSELILKGAADCVEMNSIGHLPVVIHRVLKEKALHDQRDRAEKDLRHSEAHYRALAGNLSYGICRCTLDGRFLEVNAAMIGMLGYGSKEEVLNLGLARDLIQDPDRRAKLLGQSSADALAEPVEIEWKRKDQTTLKVRLSGQAVLGEKGDLEAYEIIAEDITKQRELEAHLRQLAASDPLTGLANYRCFIDVLNAEINRSKRTGREFALLLFDVDGLKMINDCHGHLVGNQALCRVADVLSSSCRDIDTSTRYGGDEFALVLPETNTKAAHEVARRISESLATDGKEPRLSVSVGVAVYPQNGQTIERLLHEADSGLYARKQQRIVPAGSRGTAAGQ